MYGSLSKLWRPPWLSLMELMAGTAAAQAAAGCWTLTATKHTAGEAKEGSLGVK
jgi:hypothetical protein